MSIVSDKILIHKLESYCKNLDTKHFILNYNYCTKRKYFVNPESFCKYCKYKE